MKTVAKKNALKRRGREILSQLEENLFSIFESEGDDNDEDLLGEDQNEGDDNDENVPGEDETQGSGGEEDNDESAVKESNIPPLEAGTDDEEDTVSVASRKSDEGDVERGAKSLSTLEKKDQVRFITFQPFILLALGD